jgi:Outer membrane lipoprotein-sorting protein
MKFSSAAMALALISSIPAPVAGVEAHDPTALLAGPRQSVETADYRAVGHLVQVDANGKRTSYDISIKAHWFPGVLRIFVEITAPADARAHVMLEMRPNGQSSVRIAHPGDKASTVIPFDKWSDGPLGSGFSYEDFLQQEYFWPGQVALESVHRGARDCDVLKSTPGAANKTHYAEVRTWLDHTIDFPVYVEKTLKAAGTVKEFTYYDLRHDGGVWSAAQIEEKSRGQAGSTLLIINRGSPKAKLNAGEFSPERFTHF